MDVTDELKRKTTAKYNVTYEWVKGHPRGYGNDRADALATKGERENKCNIGRYAPNAGQFFNSVQIA